ncbi:RBR-type E3 ubiquitin transferase [Paragonimus heterotremus]|uniref:RBR-type E3 ubiquitin transferase n=1 Tax=Paragonimus heterotremus TaxID=100268 RepID=A0A8J4T6K7_9TREM|nr:RBR-type E3 ubiquitin transferase [Paragonimus heterotremus]
MSAESPKNDGTLDESEDDLDYYNYEEPDSYIEYERSMLDKSRIEAFKYSELEVGDVEALLNKDVEIVCNALSIPPSIARSLLISHEWDVDRVKSQFLSNPIAFLIDHGFLPVITCTSSASDSYAVMATIKVAQRLGFSVQRYLEPPRVVPGDPCSICLTTPSPSTPSLEFFPDFQKQALSSDPQLHTAGEVRVPASAGQSTGLYGLSCGHRFCADCWSCYLTAQISEGLITQLKCMAVSCGVSIPEDFVVTVIKGTPMKDKYLSIIFQRMVMSHPALRNCAGADCSVIIHALESPKARRVSCSRCKCQFCFVCGEPYHAPITCSMLKRWLRKCQDDAGTAIYMTAHTKDCPECHVCIEKSGGCNHMQCSQCKHEFCWVCLNPWSVHKTEYYNCSRYTERPDAADDQARQQARESLKRYVFYYDRWANHERSLRLEQQHRAAVCAKIREKVLKKEGTWIDWQHLLTAADTLRDCRYTLKYTYPMAYYSENMPNKTLFEYQHALLESEVEDLAWKIEHAQITDRGELQNAMDVCEKHRLTLLQEFRTE